MESRDEGQLEKARLAASTFGPKVGYHTDPVTGSKFIFHAQTPRDDALIQCETLRQYQTLPIHVALQYAGAAVRGLSDMPLVLARMQVVLDEAPADYCAPPPFKGAPQRIDVFYKVADDPERRDELLRLHAAYTQFMSNFRNPPDPAAVGTGEPIAGTDKMDGDKTPGAESEER